MAKDYIMLDLPFGIRSNGTRYGNRGAWIDSSRVRWADNALRPIGGWNPFNTNVGQLDQVIPDPSIELARAFQSWKGNDGTSYYVAGTNLKLWAWGKGSTEVFDITPEDFTPRPVEVFAPNGYGNWFYGQDAYGTARPVDEDTVGAFSWQFRTWGQNLLAAPRGAPSKLYEWPVSFPQRAEPVENAPENFDCFHVTDQRIVMIAGQGDDPRIVIWSDQEDNTEWTPQINNKAGFQRLPGVGRFRSIVTVQDQYLFVSETDAYVARYIGAPLVFGFDQLGENCGTASANAVVAVDDFAMWPGENSFYMCDGSTVRRVDCPVMDRFRLGINTTQATKTQGFANPYWPEIWWLYQEGPDDIDTYIFYNWQENHWGYGKLVRTVAGGYANVGGLVMMGADGYAYSHELIGVAPIENDQSEIFALTGPIELTKGNTTQYVKSVQPDFIENGAVNVTLIGQDRPTGPSTAFGPYRIAYPAVSRQPIPTRARGHTMSVRIEGVDGLWTLGTLRLDMMLGGEK